MSIETTIARPYAKAAFEAAVAHKNIDPWSKLLQIAAWVVNQPQIKQYLRDPRINDEQRYQCFIETCTPATEEMRNFFKFLADNKRLPVLPEVAELFEIYRVEQEKTVKAKVISAYSLSAEEKDRIRERLKKKLQREVIVDYQTDKSLLGGLVIRAGDLVIDSSVRSQLARLVTSLIN